MQWCGSSVLSRQERIVHMCLCSLALLIHCRTSSPVVKTKKTKRKVARSTCASTADGFPNACHVLKQWARRKTSHRWQVCSLDGWLTVVSPSAGPVLRTYSYASFNFPFALAHAVGLFPSPNPAIATLYILTYIHTLSLIPFSV